MSQFRESPCTALEDEEVASPSFQEALGRHDPLEALKGSDGSGKKDSKEPQEGQTEFGACCFPAQTWRGLRGFASCLSAF